jgi:site-specific DNA-methyltransferase (adenine-specific)/adenine-specific DNA-methyltransferase
MRIFCTEELHQNGGPGRFVLSRAEESLDSLLSEYAGAVQLIYLDPPFGTGDTFHISLAAGRGTVSLPVFTDTMREAEYLKWMRRVLTGAHALLSDSGSIYLHIDYRMDAKLRLLLDEIFGAKNFMNEIIWCYKSGGRSTRYYPRKHDTILFYRKISNVYFDIQAVGRPRGPEKRNHMKRYIDEDGRICFSIRSAGKLYTYYEDTPVFPSDVWDDIEHLQQKDSERVGYATQKPEALLHRIVLASSKPGDLVCDLFSGSGTTAAAASKLGRRYLVADASAFALYTLRARQLQNSSGALAFKGRARNAALLPRRPIARGFGAHPVVQHGQAMLSIDEAKFDDRYPLVTPRSAERTANDFCPLRRTATLFCRSCCRWTALKPPLCTLPTYWAGRRSTRSNSRRRRIFP